MGPFFDQIFNLLTVPPGNLIYHLVLAFSIVGALQAAFIHWRSSEFPQEQRTMLGLTILLLAQLMLFIISGLAWQGFMNPDAVLPPLDRAVTMISLIWVAWLWAFPEPSRPADVGNVVLNILTLIGLALGLASWLHAPAGSSFNATLQDAIWQAIALLFIVLVGVLLFFREPNGWGNGIAFLTLAFLGHLLNILLVKQGNFPGASRLTYMAAFSILMTIPQRFPTPAPRPTTIKSSASRQSTSKQTTSDQATSLPERRRYSTDPKTFHAMLSLAAEANVKKVNQAITRAIAQTMLADLCFLIYLTEDKSQMHVTSGYDLIREEILEGSSLENDNVPMLANAIQRGRPLRLPASGTSTDHRGLGDLIGLSNPGNLLSVPILRGEKDAIGSVLLLSPYSNRLWSAEDQNFLASIASSLLPIIERSQKVTTLESIVQKSQEQLDLAQSRLKELESQKEELANKLDQTLKTGSKPGDQADKLEAMLALQGAAEKEIERLTKENEKLLATRQESSGTSDELSYFEEELRQTLKEVAHLQNQLAEANIKILDLENTRAAPHASDQAEVIASISQELRQPMSSIVGYTDLLLGESVGILGALQRKFVERIKSSTERIGNLVDDLIQITTLDMGLTELKPEAVDLNLIIDNAMAYTSSQLREKNISLHLDILKNMSTIQADREALQQILIHLLQNAGAATPVEGRITLRVQVEDEAGQDYVLIQVTDTGGGISAEDLPRVFTRLYRADNVLIQGIGDTGVGLSIAKTLTEAQYGRIWVDSKQGEGATFSVLLPLAKNGNPAEEPIVEELK